MLMWTLFALYQSKAVQILKQNELECPRAADAIRAESYTYTYISLWTQRAEGSKAAEGRPMQRFLSTL